MREIMLTQGKVAVVDDADYLELSAFKWYALKHRHTYYAARRIPGMNGRRVRMHQMLIKAEQVDHIDGDGLNNQRTNLRPATARQNCYNKRKTTGGSRYKGVTWGADRKKWRAQIVVNYKRLDLGAHETQEAAALAYNEAARAHFGEFARLNEVQKN